MKQSFMDTAFLIALIDKSDQYHARATEWYKKLVKDNWRITTTEEVLIETGNGLAGLKWRKIAHKWIVTIRQSSSIFRVIPVTTEILDRSIELYGARMDKGMELDWLYFIHGHEGL